MTHVLTDLLTTDHPLFVRNLAELERASGNAGIDTRLIADITEKAHAIMRQLGVDPADTHGEELYHALNAAVKNGRANQLLSSSHFVLLRFDDGPVSFCLHDVIENAHHELEYNERTIANAQRHLRSEIVKRYAEHDRTSSELVHNLAEQAGMKPAHDEGHRPLSDFVNDESSKPSMLAIGDIFTDAFIKLNEAYAVHDTDEDGKEWLKLPFGSKPPYERVDIVRSVGPSPNAAVSFARLGLKSSLMAWLGDDEAGKESLKHLQSERVDTSAMITEPGSASSYWYVLRHGTDRTMLVKSESYDYTWKAPAQAPDWLYLAYIGENSWKFHEELLEYVEQNPSIQFVFQPATYHFEWGAKKLAGLYTRANIVIMNREEAMQVTDKPHDDVCVLAEALHELGPETVAITDGSKGSYVWQNNNLITIQNYPDPAPPIDRTGAGDAFASTLVAALALGKDINEALVWAPINSASVVQQVGAQGGLLSLADLQDWLSKAPDDYKTREL